MKSPLSKKVIPLRKVEFMRHTDTQMDTQMQVVVHNTMELRAAAAGCFLREVASSFRVPAPSDGREASTGQE